MNKYLVLIFTAVALAASVPARTYGGGTWDSKVAAKEVAAGYLRSNPAIAGEFGPVEVVRSHESITDLRFYGHAFMRFDVNGSKAQARAEVWLSKKDGAWTVTDAVLLSEGTRRLLTGRDKLGAGENWVLPGLVLAAVVIFLSRWLKP